MASRKPGFSPNDNQLETVLLHAFLDLIQERKAKGKRELVATMETIATWMSDRTSLPVTPAQVQSLTLALRDAHIIDVGGMGIGRPNSYDTREAEMGLDAFWDQVDAFLLVWRLPNRQRYTSSAPPAGQSADGTSSQGQSSAGAASSRATSSGGKGR